jgi:uncharacterized protein YktA (UPF0223 family)
MRINSNDFIAYWACALVLAIVFGVTTFDTTHANTNTSLNKNVPKLAGTWQINRKKSDDPQDKLRGTMRGDDGGGLRGRRSSGAVSELPAGNAIPGGAPQRGLPDGANTSGRDDMGTVRTRMEEESRAAEVLEIIQTNSEITVNETGSDRLVNTQTFYTDARKSEHETAREKLETVARWEGNKFIVVTKGREGRITRIYELKSGGRELYLTVKIENEQMPRVISIRSVYDKSS